MDANASDAEIERLLAHSGWLTSLARRLVQDPATADDLVQDTWAAALRSPSRGAQRGQGWLFTVFANLARARSREEGARRRREMDAARPERISGPDELVERAESQRRLLALVLALDEPYRSTLLARFVEAQSAAEIARNTGTNESTVRTRVARALQRLRESLASEHGADPRLGLGVLLGMPHAMENGVAPSAGSGLGGLAAGAGIGAWIMGTTAKVAAAAAVFCVLWFAWKNADPASLPPELAAAPATAPAVPSAPMDTELMPAATDPRAPLQADDPIPRGGAADALVFHGRVLDEVTRAPLGGVGLELRGGVPNAQRASTDADGRFSLRVAGWNQGLIALDAEGYARAWVLPTQGHHTPASGFEVLLARPASLRVHVQDASGAPIADARIRAVVPRYELLQSDLNNINNLSAYEDESFSALTDTGGTALISGLPPRARLQLSAAHLREVLHASHAPLVLQPGEQRDLDWRAGAGCRVFGNVKESDGAPAAGQEVWLQPARMPVAVFLELNDREGRRTARCDAAGEFEFADVPAGAWWVGPADARGQNGAWVASAATALARHVEVQAETLESRVDFVLSRDLAIRGRVEDPDGQPLGAMDVEAWHMGTEAMSMTRSAPDGSFALGPLVPGEYRVVAGQFGAMGHARFTASRKQWITPPAIDVVLRMELGCSIRGRVVDAQSGESLAAHLTLGASGGAEAIGFLVRTSSCEAGEELLVSGLPASTYSLVASASSGRIGILSPITLAPGEQLCDLELRLSPGASLSIAYDGPAPYGSVQLLFDGVVIAVDGIAQGTRRDFTVPAGRCVARMTLYPQGAMFDTVVALGVGASAELRFDGAWK